MRQRLRLTRNEAITRLGATYLFYSGCASLTHLCGERTLPVRPIFLRLSRCVIYAAFCGILFANVASATDIPLSPDTAKKQLEARGVGSMVKVKQADGKELRAKIVSIGETAVILQVGSKPTVEVPYSRMTAVKGGGLSKGAKVAIVVGAVLIACAYPATHI